MEAMPAFVVQFDISEWSQDVITATYFKIHAMRRITIIQCRIPEVCTEGELYKNKNNTLSGYEVPEMILLRDRSHATWS